MLVARRLGREGAGNASDELHREASSLVHGFRVDFLHFLHGYDVAGVAPCAADEGEDVRKVHAESVNQ